MSEVVSRDRGGAAEPAIRVRGVDKAYGSTPVLRSLDLDVPAGSITAVLGASGSGKTTLLRLVAGFDTIDSGQLSIAGRVVDDGRRTVRAQHRNIGYVPQDAALFPHLTVLANVGFGVPRRRRSHLAELLDLVGLGGYGRRYPHQLSGGQQQRVALARALAVRPDVVLLDEPFGSLDAALREVVRADTARILAATRTTTVLVTHDQDEALSVAQHLVLLHEGRVTADGAPRELYEHPPTPEVAAAIGVANILSGHLDDGTVRCALGVLPVAHAYRTRTGACRLMLRPEQLQVGDGPAPGTTAARVLRVRYHGHDTLLDLSVDADQGSGEPAVTARVTGGTPWQAGDQAWLAVAATPHVWPC